MNPTEAKARLKHIVRTLLHLGVSEDELNKAFATVLQEIKEENNSTS